VREKILTKFKNLVEITNWNKDGDLGREKRESRENIQIQSRCKVERRKRLLWSWEPRERE
jgi:hypothetical protein